MKTNLRILLAFLTAAALMTGLAAGGGTAEKTVPASPEEAEEFVHVLLGDSPASLDAQVLMTPQMEKAMAQAGGFAAVAAQLAPLGAAGEIGPAYETVLGGMKTFRVPCRFALIPLDIALTLDGGALAGLTTQPFTGDSVKAGEEAFLSADLALPVPGLGELPGTLTLPGGGGPFPAVVLVHGSGPSDRDERLGGLAPFRDIAESLPEKGIAVYRYDKRTYVYPRETGADTGFTLMEECVLDAAAAVQLLASREEIDGERIFVLGHSLGASAVPAIDRELEKAPVRARGYILLAPAARRADILLREQLSSLAQEDPETAAYRDALLAELDLPEDPSALPEDRLIAGAYPAYWAWLSAYDIPARAKEISLPCLLLWGTEDRQVPQTDFDLFREAVGDTENWTLLSLPGITHMFTSADGAGERVSTEVIDRIALFILGN